jgi:hypothetical protein
LSGLTIEAGGAGLAEVSAIGIFVEPGGESGGFVAVSARGLVANNVEEAAGGVEVGEFGTLDTDVFGSTKTGSEAVVKVVTVVLLVISDVLGSMVTVPVSKEKLEAVRMHGWGGSVIFGWKDVLVGNNVEFPNTVKVAVTVDVVLANE